MVVPCPVKKMGKEQFGVSSQELFGHLNFEVPTRHQNRNLNVYFSSQEKIMVAWTGMVVVMLVVNL